LSAAAARADEKTVERAAPVREGPGAYYEVRAELARGARVQVKETRGYWSSIRSEPAEGWVAAAAFARPKAGIDYSGLLAAQGPERISSVDIAAGTKGAFVTAWSRKHASDPAMAAILAGFRPVPSKVDALRRGLAGREAAPILARLPRRPFENTVVVLPEAEEALGRALAAHLLAGGLVRDEALNAYVNEVAAVVGAKTERYDLLYRVGIMDDDSLQGFGLPGGYILLSRGLLGTLKNEAELACLLGHEMTHASRYHGLREFNKRDFHRRRDAAFDELDALTGDAPSSVEAELGDVADTAYLKIIGGRARADEMEADLCGVAYAAAAGYDPRAMLGVLRRAAAGSHEDTFRHHPPLSERLEAVEAAITRYGLSRADQQTAETRFRRRVAK
jgi:Zn-dependent protease with chaperone function